MDVYTRNAIRTTMVSTLKVVGVFLLYAGGVVFAISLGTWPFVILLGVYFLSLAAYLFRSEVKFRAEMARLDEEQKRRVG